MNNKIFNAHFGEFQNEYIDFEMKTETYSERCIIIQRKSLQNYTYNISKFL